MSVFDPVGLLTFQHKILFERSLPLMLFFLDFMLLAILHHLLVVLTQRTGQDLLLPVGLLSLSLICLSLYLLLSQWQVF